ncbi:MAG: DsbA family protein [Kofleriaceae bacterium]
MNKYLLGALLITVAACQPDNSNIERKLDEQTKYLKAIADNMGKGGMGGPGAAQARPSRPEPDRSKTYSVPIEGDAFDGPANAKVTVVKAYDYACPYCEKVRPTMADLRAKYGNDLRVVYKQLVVHPRNAMASALAFCAADKQGKSKDMDRLLWDKGFKARNLDNSDVAEAPAAPGQAPAPGGGSKKCWDQPGGCPIVVGFAQELKLNVDKFKADMKGDCVKVVQKDMQDLQKLGVAATPGFFINGRFLSGAQPIDNFTTLVDEELKKANEAISKGTPQDKYYQTVVVEKGLKSLDPSKG